jgi:chromosome segregation ATPase
MPCVRRRGGHDLHGYLTWGGWGMKPKFLNGLLRDEEKGAGGDGGGASNVIALPGAEAGAAGAEVGGEGAGEAEKKPGMLESVLGALQTKGSLVAEISGLKEKVTAAEGEALKLRGELETANGELVRVRGELVTLQGERQQIAAALEASQKEVTTVEAKALDLTAGLGISSDKLPEASAEGGEQGVEALEKALAKETDPKRIFTLNQELEAAKAKAKAEKAQG